ncbi:MAG: sigma-70 family RNA polymerase sigma factor [Blautia sp.]|nr:sigma-70 family RNA polymerase sigma factor [Eubacteriales bacterium]MED9965852.1 sigma-70 family RNA polymerase sigma factor [Blautia sp.]
MEILVKKAKKGDTDAFAQLIRMNAQSMYKVAWAYLKNEEDAADAIQETILICYEKLGTLKKSKYFKTWLIRILMNQCNDLLKTRRRETGELEQAETAYEESGYYECEWKEILLKLDEKYRVIVTLYYGQGLSVKEISKLLELNQNTVLTRLSRAREKLRKEYEM